MSPKISFRGTDNIMRIFSCSQAYVRVQHITRTVVVRVMRILAPVSLDEDLRRREFILHIILAISIVFLLILEATIVRNYLFFSDRGYDGINPIQFGGIILFCGALFLLSKKGYAKISSYILISIYSFGAIYSGWTWGESLPATLLATALVIVTSSVLIGSSFGSITAGIMIVTITILGVHEKEVLGVPLWHAIKISVTDIVTYSALFIFMSFISWLSNREITKSLKRARDSEKLLEIERNTLEHRVALRTADLIATKEKEALEFSRNAQFGELSQGLFHDLMNPLSSISLYMEDLTRVQKQPIEMYDAVRNIITVSRRMDSYMNSVKRCIGKNVSITHNTNTDFSEEIRIVKDVLGYKARMAHVHISSEVPMPISVSVHPIHIHQILINLVSNAIDAYAFVSNDSKLAQEHKVHIRILYEAGMGVIISVGDDGCGMSEEHIKNVGKNFNSTKAGGTGIGLVTVRSIVERDLKGTFTIASILGKGTRFVVTIPHTYYVPTHKPTHTEPVPHHRTPTNVERPF